MTSKQLVNHLCYEYGTKNYNEEKLKASQELKKCLEVLEIIKKYEISIYWAKIYTYYDYVSAVDSTLPKEDFDKVKEWLENE